MGVRVRIGVRVRVRVRVRVSVSVRVRVSVRVSVRVRCSYTHLVLCTPRPMPPRSTRMHRPTTPKLPRGTRTHSPTTPMHRPMLPRTVSAGVARLRAWARVRG